MVMFVYDVYVYCISVCVCVHAHAMAHVWKSDDNCEKSVLSFSLGFQRLKAQTTSSVEPPLSTDPASWLTRYLMTGFNFAL